MDSRELNWLAGVWEGEGCFHQTTYTNHHWSGRLYRYPVIKAELAMTDQDVVERIAGLLSTKVIVCPQQNANHKTLYRVSLQGKRAAGLMMTLFTLLGNRRRAKITELLMMWRTQ